MKKPVWPCLHSYQTWIPSDAEKDAAQDHALDPDPAEEDAQNHGLAAEEEVAPADDLLEEVPEEAPGDHPEGPQEGPHAGPQEDQAAGVHPAGPPEEVILDVDFLDLVLAG